MAARYWVGGSDTWNNIAGTKWSATSGGAGGASAPTASDDVFFDANSGTGTITTATTAACLTCNFTGFTGTFNMGTSWNVATSLTLSSGMTIVGSGIITKTGNGGTWTSNGKAVSGSGRMPLGGGFSTSFADDWVFQGDFYGQPASVNLLGSGGVRTITVLGSLGNSSTFFTCSNLTFVMGGTGNLEGAYGSTSISINTSGVITQNTLSLTSCNLTYISGTFNSISAIRIAGASTINNFGGIPINSISYLTSAGQNLTIDSDIEVGAITVSTTAGILNGTGFKVFCTGNLTPGAGLSGTAIIEMSGTTNVNISAGTLSNNLIINKTGGGGVNLTGNIIFGVNGRYLEYVSGILNPNTTTVTIPLNTSVTLIGFTFYNLTINGGSTVTITIPSRITVQNNLTVAVNGNVMFSGTAGFITQAFSVATVGSTITFEKLGDFDIESSINSVGTSASRITWVSSDRTVFTGSISGNILSVSSVALGSISVGQTLSHSSGIIPPGLSDLLPNRPTIIAQLSPTTWELDLTLSTPVPSQVLSSGTKARVTLSPLALGSNQNIGYMNTQDIDSSNGQPIFSFGSINDTNLFRTLNWGPLLAPTPYTIGQISIR